jgi:autotransporter-associated beta strand protein
LSLNTNGLNVIVGQAPLNAMSGADGGLTNGGSGRLTVGGNNTYTGLTSIQAGTLIVNVSPTI